MRRTLGVGVVLLLAALLVPSEASAQQSGGERAKFQLRPSYPNPFNPTTKIPFCLDQVLFESGKPVVVQMRIKNILGQVVAVPEALNHPDGKIRVERLEYATAGCHEAYWDGTDRFGRKVASAMYLLELVVNGERAPPQKLVVAK